MNRPSLIIAAALLMSAAAAASQSDTEPSAQVQTVPLRQGSLPRTVVVYGNVQPAASARQIVVAPVAATVDTIYVRPGQSVAQGAPLIRLQPSPSTASSYAQARSAVAAARQRVTSTQQLLTQHLATHQQLTDAEQSEADAQATLSALQAQGAGGANVLRAPVAAVVTGIATRPGALVSEGVTLLDLAPPHGLVLAAGATPASASQIRSGDAVDVKPIGTQATFPAKVVARGSAVDVATGLIPIEIALPAGKALPGQMAEATITVGDVHGYVVPHEAILVNDKGEPYVVQDLNGRAHKVAVTILETQGSRDVVNGTLDAKAPLVLDGNYQADEGMKLRVAGSSRPVSSESSSHR
jgi:RND family efflux transporter MFP subunit